MVGGGALKDRGPAPVFLAACDRFIQDRAALHFLDVLAKVADRQLFGTETVPSSGLSSPTTMRNSVVLPAPLGPTSPTFSPGFNWN